MIESRLSTLSLFFGGVSFSFRALVLHQHHFWQHSGFWGSLKSRNSSANQSCVWRREGGGGSQSRTQVDERHAADFFSMASKTLKNTFKMWQITTTHILINFYKWNDLSCSLWTWVSGQSFYHPYRISEMFPTEKFEVLLLSDWKTSTLTAVSKNSLQVNSLIALNPVKMFLYLF